MTPGVFRCGWPFRLPRSTAVAYCTDPLGHDGPHCRLVDTDGVIRATAPRFDVHLEEA